MLEQMRKNSRSLLITVLFAIIIVVFILSFGPQSRGTTCDQVTGNEEGYAAKVAGQTISKSDFRYGWLLSSGDRMPPKMARQARINETVMDKLIERELLAAMAEKLGFVVTEDEVAEQIADARIIALGSPVNVAAMQKDGRFSYEAFKNFVRMNLQQSPAAFEAQQRKEMLAARVRDLVRSSVTVSPDEAKNEFIRKNRQVNLEYMRFTSRTQESAVAPTDEELAAFATKNEAKLKEIYEQKKFLYEKAPAQRRIRQILIKLPHDADEKADKAAKAKADALVEKLKRGGAKAATSPAFAELAKQASDDTATKARGGDLGWRARGGTNLSGAAEDKLFAAKDGAIVGPEKGTDGYVISRVEGSREGHIPFEKARLELADEKYRQEQGVTRAKAAAEAALAKANATPAATLKTVFPPPSDTQEASTDTSGPRVEETGLFALRASPEGVVIEGIGVSNALAKAAFALTADKPLAGPIAVGDNFYVIRLKERKEPDLADFEKRKLELVREAAMAKSERVLTDFMQATCVEAKDAKRISVNLSSLKYNDESGEVPSYEPCTGHRLFGG